MSHRKKSMSVFLRKIIRCVDASEKLLFRTQNRGLLWVAQLGQEAGFARAETL